MTQEFSAIANIIEQAFENRAQINSQTQGEVRQSVKQALDLLDSGKLRVCNKVNDVWQVNQWLKKAILLSFRLNDNFLSKQQAEVGNALTFYDKVDLKFNNWQEQDFRKAGFRALPGAVVRKGSFIAKNVVLMPSFVNKGAYVDESTMVDTWATIGSCAQIGKNCHISGGAGIGGVLEPLQANPVIIEDDCFIGARSEIAEGVIVEKGSVISMGVYIGASTKIIDRSSGEIFYGKVPAYSVVVPGSIASSKLDDKTLSLYCAVIVKKVDEKTRSKTSINELLRD
ncbi:MAG: 2,3,4,5-tetrahydropyridine-2,6-dicarboxylate N-succinyltransferase [Alphaproteobacteria bacterium]